MRFLIRGPEGEQFEMTDATDGPEPVAYFLDEYEPKGFDVVTSPPTGYDVPDIKAAKAERREKERAAKAKADEKADAKAKDA